MLIATPDGSATVDGVCKKCGIKKTYIVYPEELNKLRTTVVDKVTAKW